ncbi:hypothetical protein ACFSL6_21075 [Paenibacillus thailandensis]|uniref:hypothetical protein n=1 Tax=Paenibacillus thailandensis TaxID=393250 RepID=UPI00363D37DF
MRANVNGMFGLIELEANGHADSDLCDWRRRNVGRWLSLPMHPDDLRKAMQEIADGNEALEIRDFEAPFIIERDDDVFTVNEVAAVMAQYDHRLVYALCGCTDNADQVIRILNGDSSVCIMT